MILVKRDSAEGLVNCGLAMRDRSNKSATADPLGAFGWWTIDAYTKIDHFVAAGDDTVADPEGCYLAQTDMAVLDSLAKHHPNAKIFLSVRRPKSWLATINRWTAERHNLHPGGLRGHLTACGFPGLAAGVGARDEDMLAWYESHKQRIRAFVREHPNLKLIEVPVEDPKAGPQLARATGLPVGCWRPTPND